MFKSFSLTNFKCFSQKQNFNLKSINVFTGYNGRGKSTVFQSFLLLAQSLYDNKNLYELLVNGMFCRLGLFEELRNHNNESQEIRFAFETDNDSYENVELVYKEKSDRKGALADIIVNDKSFLAKTQSIGDTTESEFEHLQHYPEEIHGAFDNFYFVSADRLGPTPFEVKQDLYDHNPIGYNGEFRLNVLAGNDNLQHQLATVISEVMDGGDLSVKGDSDTEKTHEVLKLYFTSALGEKPVKSINSGFGYSYIIPILLAAISMRHGCLFIENPEAHLHPCAQSKLIKELVLLCKKNNIQLFIETHSEHVINALRLCSLYDGEYEVFTNDDLSMYFFDKDMSVQKLTLLPDGQVEKWPLGFFDQAERDAAEILRMGLLK